MKKYTRSSIQFDEQDMEQKEYLKDNKVSIVATWRKGAEVLVEELQNCGCKHK